MFIYNALTRVTPCFSGLSMLNKNMCCSAVVESVIEYENYSPRKDFKETRSFISVK